MVMVIRMVRPSAGIHYRKSPTRPMSVIRHSCQESQRIPIAKNRSHRILISFSITPTPYAINLQEIGDRHKDSPLSGGLRAISSTGIIHGLSCHWCASMTKVPVIPFEPFHDMTWPTTLVIVTGPVDHGAIQIPSPGTRLRGPPLNT